MTVRTATRKTQGRQGLTDWFVGMMQTTGENGCSVDLEHQSATRPRNHFFFDGSAKFESRSDRRARREGATPRHQACMRRGILS